jgi:hypothetical protein
MSRIFEPTPLANPTPVPGLWAYFLCWTLRHFRVIEPAPLAKPTPFPGLWAYVFLLDPTTFPGLLSPLLWPNQRHFQDCGLFSSAGPYDISRVIEPTPLANPTACPGLWAYFLCWTLRHFKGDGANSNGDSNANPQDCGLTSSAGPSRVMEPTPMAIPTTIPKIVGLFPLLDTTAFPGLWSQLQSQILRQIQDCELIFCATPYGFSRVIEPTPVANPAPTPGMCA